MNDLLFLAAAEAQSDGIVPGLVRKFEGVGVNTGGLIAQIIVFAVLAFALKKFAFDPILAVMDQRRKEIEASLANAEQIKKELAEAEANRKEIVRQANVDAMALIEEAKKSADALGGKKMAEAAAQAELILLRAEETALRDREKLLSDLKKEVASLVIQTTGKVLGRTITSEDEARLRQEVVGSVS
ncbi:MAG: F0F1 ATP synthase subunit B [Blastochloris sp.]|jgi:F-type H+-transporting ATPase subunit b|nr:F0F1 ATP synthase subunit B [Blastochloris sp.]